MTALRQQAIDMIENFPDESLVELIKFMQAENLRRIEKEQRLEKKRVAFEELKKLCRPIPDLDDDKAKAEYMEKKFGI